MSLRSIIDELKSVLSDIRNAASRISGVNCSTEGLGSVSYRLNNAPIYQSPWELITTDGSDALGNFKIVEKTYPDHAAGEVSVYGGYYRLKAGLTRKDYVLFPSITLCLASNDGEILPSFDFSNIGSVTPTYYNSDWAFLAFLPSAYRIIFGEYQSLKNRTIGYARFEGGLYLPRQATVQAGWVYDTVTTEFPVKCPVNANCAYYLNRFGVSAEDMVGIFENLFDRSAQTSTKYITLGSTNLAKLTEEQKNIAYAKGWDLA